MEQRLAIWTGLLLACAVSVSAVPTMLNFVPTTEVMGRGQVLLGGTLTSTSTALTAKYERYKMLTVGLTDWLEAGVDRDYAGNHTWHAKARLLAEPRTGLALAFGVMNCDRGVGDTYFSASIPWGAGRFHTALFFAEDERIPMVGFEWPLTDSLSLLVDHAGGSLRWNRVGLCMWLSASVYLYGSVPIPARPQGYGQEVGIAWAVPLGL